MGDWTIRQPSVLRRHQVVSGPLQPRPQRRLLQRCQRRRSPPGRRSPEESGRRTWGRPVKICGQPMLTLSGHEQVEPGRDRIRGGGWGRGTVCYPVQETTTPCLGAYQGRVRPRCSYGARHSCPPRGQRPYRHGAGIFAGGGGKHIYHIAWP